MKLLTLPLLTISTLLVTPINTNKLDSSRNITSINDLMSTTDEIKSYYSSLDGKNLKGDAFLSALQDILEKDQKKADYNGGSTSWYNYFLLDRDYDKSPLTEKEINNINNNKKNWWLGDNVYCEILYEQEPHIFKKSETNQQNKFQIDREHIYPKSYGFNVDGDGYKNLLAGCDMHNLHMGEGLTNRNIHKDLPYGNIDSNKQEGISSLSNTVGSYLGYSNTAKTNVIEPLDKDKGDIARSIFYMAARYHNYEEINEYGPTPRLLLSDTPYKFQSTVTPQQTKDNPTYYGILKDLIEWNKIDVVSEHEKTRNDLCYTYIQNNRNPFIDYPLWADIAFNENTNYVVDLNSKDGVRDISFDVTWPNYKENYNSGEEINLSNVTITYKGENISNNNINITYFNKLAPNSIQEIETSSLKLKDGYYEITFSYKSDTSVSKSFNIKIGNPKESFNVDFSSINTSSSSFKNVDLSKITATYSIGETKIFIDNPELSFSLSKNGSNTNLDTRYFNTELFGKYKLIASYKDFKDDILTDSLEITVNIPKSLIIIIGILFLLIILIFIISLIIKAKKKAKKSITKKPFVKYKNYSGKSNSRKK